MGDRSKSKAKTAAEELGFRIVELPRPRDRSPEPEPHACPSCKRPFSEIASVNEEIDAGDGHSVIHLERRRGLCPSCGWIDL